MESPQWKSQPEGWQLIAVKKKGFPSDSTINTFEGR
jgi:hypothetical protein